MQQHVVWYSRYIIGVAKSEGIWGRGGRGGGAGTRCVVSVLADYYYETATRQHSTWWTAAAAASRVELSSSATLLLVQYTIKMVCCGVSARSTRESFDNIFSIIIIIIISSN